MSPTTITLLLLAFAIVMFIWERIPLALTAMIVCVALAITGVLTPAEAFEGFVNSNVILFVAMFIIGGALFQTGMASEIGGLVTRFARTERQLVVAIMLITLHTPVPGLKSVQCETVLKQRPTSPLGLVDEACF